MLFLRFTFVPDYVHFLMKYSRNFKVSLALNLIYTWLFLNELDIHQSCHPRLMQRRLVRVEVVGGSMHLVYYNTASYCSGVG